MGIQQYFIVTVGIDYGTNVINRYTFETALKGGKVEF